MMTFNDYQAGANRTGNVLAEDLASNLNHAALGLTTEVGEFVSEVKRIVRYGKACTPEMHDHMVEELGDVMWYIAIAAETLGVRMEEMAEKNIDKLRLRFPDKFSNEAAEARADKGGLPHTES
jgi:NTP pyrophosphatase (non-canonical NTP hydrolase)